MNDPINSKVRKTSNKEIVAELVAAQTRSARNRTDWVKRSLASHSWLGLLIAGLMYLVCLSGTLVVLFEELERWEQPNIEEYSDYSADQIALAVDEFMSRVDKIPESTYVVLPSDAVPRIHVSGDGQEWFVNRDGSLSEEPVHGWTHFLKELHINLHLPQTFGIIIVGILGAMLCGLIVTGILAHPRILKDAFTWRRYGQYRLAQADLHNRLSVWGTPFYFMIGLTGAFIGLVGIFIAASASAFFNSDREAVVNAVYGEEPVVTESANEINYQAIFDNLTRYEPDAEPIYLVIQNKGDDNQFVEVAATLPQRLIYSELYQFRSNGELISHQGMSDGAIGRQVAYSVYRLHFGHFAGFPVKVIYLLMGLCLTVICATGVNIWLARRKHRSFINDLWVAIVWGIPFALSVSLLSLFIPMTPLVLFLSMWTLSLITALTIKNTERSQCLLQLGAGLSLLLVSVLHWSTVGIDHALMVVHGINLLWLLAGMILVVRSGIIASVHQRLTDKRVATQRKARHI